MLSLPFTLFAFFFQCDPGMGTSSDGCISDERFSLSLLSICLTLLLLLPKLCWFQIRYEVVQVKSLRYSTLVFAVVVGWSWIIPIQCLPRKHENETKE